MKTFREFIKMFEYTDTYKSKVTAKRQMVSKNHLIKKDTTIPVHITDVPSSKIFDIVFTNKNRTSTFQYTSKTNALKDWQF